VETFACGLLATDEVADWHEPDFGVGFEQLLVVDEHLQYENFDVEMSFVLKISKQCLHKRWQIFVVLCPFSFEQFLHAV
jgi:hypothetical protein